MCGRMRPVRLLVAISHMVVREGLKSWLADMGSARPVEIEEARDTEEALDKVFSARFDLVILEYALPGRGGLKMLEMILARRSDLPILGWAYTNDPRPGEQMMRAGAKGYLLATSEREVLLMAIWTVLSGRRFYCNGLPAPVIEDIPINLQEALLTLTDRDKVVFRLVIDGLTNREIAERFGVPEKTVIQDQASLMVKLGVRDVTQLLRVAMGLGWMTGGKFGKLWN